jgi:outer membrane protein assembly factor BamB
MLPPALIRNFCKRKSVLKHFRVAILFLAGLGALSSFDATALDWPRWRGPDANGISKETGWSSSWPAEGPKQLWKANVGTGFSSMSVSGGRVYTIGNRDNRDTVYCFNADMGEAIWKHTYAEELDPHYYEGGSSSTPTVDGDAVYTFSRKGELFRFDATTGKVVWIKNLAQELGLKIPEWGFASSPLVEGNLLIVNAGSAGTALDKATGNAAWISGKGSAGYSGAAPFNVGQERFVALFLADSVAAFKVTDGKELWRHKWKTSYDVNAADPIVSGDKVFVSSGYNRGCALLQVSGDRASALWENKNMRNHFNSCVLLDGCLYGFDESELKCLDLKTGAVKWTERSLGKSALMAADGKLILQGERGQLVIAEASPAGFKPLARAQVLGGKCWTTPVLANGRIYCRNANGDLVCVDVSGNRTAR